MEGRQHREMNAHHLIMGHTADFITGELIDDTHDERYRQKIARLLVDEKGYAKSDIRGRQTVALTVGGRRALVPISFVIDIDGRAAMLIHYGPGSIVTRHKPAIALARIAAPYQIPVVVVTNGEEADILDGVSAHLKGRGLKHIPSRSALEKDLKNFAWTPVAPQTAALAARIVMAFEVDDRCPCDDSICIRPALC